MAYAWNDDVTYCGLLWGYDLSSKKKLSRQDNKNQQT